MKTSHRLRIQHVALLILLVSVSCSNETSYEEALERNSQKIEDPQRLADARFIVELKSLNMAQLALLEIATESGYSSALVNLGRDNINSFKTLSRDLTELARNEEFRLPTEMSADHQSGVDRIKQTSRQDLDAKVVAELHASSESTLQKLTAMATEGDDADVRAFAARQVGLLRTHLAKIRDVEDRLLTTVEQE